LPYNTYRGKKVTLRIYLVDSAKEVALEIVTIAKRLRYAVAREDLTGLKGSLRKLPKNHRTRLLLMSYSRIEKRID
jgi:IS605 OrfB family transposase